MLFIYRAKALHKTCCFAASLCQSCARLVYCLEHFMLFLILMSILSELESCFHHSFIKLLFSANFTKISIFRKQQHLGATLRLFQAPKSHSILKSAPFCPKAYRYRLQVTFGIFMHIYILIFNLSRYRDILSSPQQFYFMHNFYSFRFHQAFYAFF